MNLENRKAYALIMVMMVASVALIGAAMLTVPRVTLTLQTTTSMQDSGLLDLIKPAFDEKYGVNLRWVAVGTGQALTNAGRGDGDVVIVHSKASELEFINHTSTKYSYSGQGIFRVSFAYNYYVIVGPTNDPAGISTNSTIANNGTRVFKAIYDYCEANPSQYFASRGDKSGTNTKEEGIWKLLGVNGTVQTKSWYKSLGQGMGPTLTYSNQVGAYTLTDYGTWLKMKSTLTYLKVASGKTNSDLKNTYSIIAVDPAKHPNVNFDLAKKLIYFMVHEGQNIIGNYTIDGEAVFTKYLNPNPTVDCFCHSSQCDVCSGSYHLCPTNDQSSVSLAPVIDNSWNSMIQLKKSYATLPQGA